MFLLVFSRFPPGTKFTFKWTRNPDDFVLMYGGDTAAAYKIVIEDCSMDIRFVSLHDSIYQSHMTRFKNKGLSIHPFDRTELRKFAFPSGLRTTCISNAFNSGLCPKMLFLFLADSEAVQGHRKKVSKTKSCNFFSHLLLIS